MTSPKRNRLAIDIGGTFTDLALHVGDELITAKTLTTYPGPERGVLRGVDQVLGAAGVGADMLDLIIHGTTLATNALIERRGATTALLTTAGHRDALEMAYENRFEQYDINIDRPAPLVPRYLRFGISERLDAAGRVLVPLDEAAVEAVLPQLDAHDVTSIAVGLLHAYANPDHEQRIAAILRAHRDDWSITLASAVCPEIREFERLSTACANAYVQPLMARYLHRLDGALRERGSRCPFLLMSSGGGLLALDTAAAFPIRLVESGPAGGAILAAAVAARGDLASALSFDMGGTTAKLCLLDDGRPLASRSFEVDRRYRFKKGSGLPVRIPVIEMVEIGAGGGSVCGVDKLRRIRVGPDSAGSDPGPACYDRGGEKPTVTDADLLLGRLDAEAFAGGSMPLSPGRAAAALTRDVGAVLDLTVDAAAAGVVEIVDENMALAARAHASEWGKGLDGRALIAFGGAAPLHAARLAEKLGITRVVVPPGAGVGSALGFLLAPVAYEVVRSRHLVLSQVTAELIDSVFTDMRGEAAAVLEAAAPGMAREETRRAYMRYVGQGYEVAVDLPESGSAAIAAALPDRFAGVYRSLYGRIIPDVEIEILSWTLTLSAGKPEPLPASVRAIVAAAAPPALTRGGAAPRAAGRPATVRARASLRPGETIPGPALITEDQTTTMVTAAFTARIDAGGALILERGGDAV